MKLRTVLIIFLAFIILSALGQNWKGVWWNIGLGIFCIIVDHRLKLRDGEYE